MVMLTLPKVFREYINKDFHFCLQKHELVSGFVMLAHQTIKYFYFIIKPRYKSVLLLFFLINNQANLKLI